jgi:hypothetical protein
MDFSVSGQGLATMCCAHGNEHSGLMKGKGGNLSQRLSAYQVLCYIEFVSCDL